MSNNSVDLSALVSQGLGGNVELPAGLPDEVELTRLANQYLSALPNQTEVLNSTPIPEVVAPQLVNLQSLNGLQTVDETALSSLVQHGSGLLGAGLIRQAAVSVPGVQQSPAAFSGSPGFYFLQHASVPADKPQLPGLETAHPAFDVHAVRRDFPILQERVNGHQLAWLDNATTTQSRRQ